MVFGIFFVSILQPFSFFNSYHKKKYINPKFIIMKKILIALVLFIGLLQVSCSPETISNFPTTNPVDVYVAGTKDLQACYWKNGQITLLDSGGFTDVLAYKVIVSNNDVYVFGQGYLNNQFSTETFFYWKNGILTNLKTAFITNSQIVASISDMEVVGNDVYFVGFMKPALLAVEIYDLVYWKNGVKTVVAGNINGSGTTHIAFQNNDVYVTLSPTFNQSLSGYYKNNDFYYIPDSDVVGITAVNNQMLVYGRQNYDGFYKNLATNATTVVSNVNDANVLKIISDNNNFYYSNNSQIFKNGTLFNESLAPNVLSDFKIINDNLYKIDSAIYGNTNDNQTVVINNNIVSTTTSGEFYNKLFVVQN